jgi:hypothetical protein
VSALRYERAHPRELAEAAPLAYVPIGTLEFHGEHLPFGVDHAALVETSWMLALEPELVLLDRLSDDPDASHVGVYGRNPRFTASADFGEAQIAAAAELPAERARALLDGRRPDPYADLRAFVEHGWPERPILRGRAGALVLENPGRASRYLSAFRVEIDGRPVDELVLVNHSPGETGIPVPASELGPEHGFYLRRGQQATITLDVAPGRHHVRAELGLGGVTSLVLEEDIEFKEADGWRS